MGNCCIHHPPSHSGPSNESSSGLSFHSFIVPEPVRTAAVSAYSVFSYPG